MYAELKNGTKVKSDQGNEVAAIKNDVFGSNYLKERHLSSQLIKYSEAL